MAEIQGSLQTLQLSFDSGTTYKSLICATSLKGKLDAAVNATDTNCGRKYGTTIPGFTVNVDAVADAAPDTTECSVADLISVANALTTVQFKYGNSAEGTVTANSVYYFAGDCKISNLEITADTGQVVKFTFELTAVGDIDTTP